MTPLHWACKRGNINIVSLLIQYKSDLDAYDLQGRTALWFAINENNIELVKLLLYNKASPWSSDFASLNDVM